MSDHNEALRVISQKIYDLNYIITKQENNITIGNLLKRRESLEASYDALKKLQREVSGE